jgi:hypothetical protein
MGCGKSVSKLKEHKDRKYNKVVADANQTTAQSYSNELTCYHGLLAARLLRLSKRYSRDCLAQLKMEGVFVSEARG